MKNIKSINITNNIIFLLIIINMFSFLNKYFFDIYENLFAFINFTILLIIFILRGKVKKNEINGYIFIFCFALYGISTLLITGGGIGSVFMPVYSFMLLFTILNTDFSRAKLKILLVTLIIVNILLVLNSKNYYLRFVFEKNRYINSNTIAMVLMYTSIYFSILSKKLEIKMHRLLSLIVYLVNIWAMVNLQSRAALLGLTAFILIDTFIPKRFFKNSSIMLSMFLIVVIVGTIAPLIYVKLYTLGLDYKFILTSKSLFTGRETIWINFIKFMNEDLKNWIFGLGSKITLWTNHGLNLHNNYLAILTNFGFVGYMLYYGFIFTQIKNIYRTKYVNNFEISSMIGFLCIFINGYFEVSTLYHPMFFFNFLLLGFALNQNNEERTRV